MKQIDWNQFSDADVMVPPLKKVAAAVGCSVASVSVERARRIARIEGAAKQYHVDTQDVPCVTFYATVIRSTYISSAKPLTLRERWG